MGEVSIDYFVQFNLNNMNLCNIGKFNPVGDRILPNGFASFFLLVPNFGGIVGKDGPDFLAEPQIAGWQCIGKVSSCVNWDVSSCQF